MEVCYEAEIRVRKGEMLDNSGLGSFRQVDDKEFALKVLLYPDVIDNSEIMKMVFRQILDGFKAHYRRAKDRDDAGREQELQQLQELKEQTSIEEA